MYPENPLSHFAGRLRLVTQASKMALSVPCLPYITVRDSSAHAAESRTLLLPVVLQFRKQFLKVGTRAERVEVVILLHVLDDGNFVEIACCLGLH